jgi:1-acyl-sn-glycerol-3-phosphate acyltransferase
MTQHASFPSARGAANDVRGLLRWELTSLTRLAQKAPLVLTAVVCALGEPLLRRSSPQATALLVQRWARTILAMANVEVTVKGAIPRGPGLFVCNHRSYIDILALLSCDPITFICKKEVASWPLIGAVATRMGVIFVDRGSPQSRDTTLHAVADAVLAGARVMAFPEGTTYVGPGMGSMRPGLFRAAEARGFALFPVVLEYDDPHDAWVGADTLLRHASWWLSKKNSRVTVSFGSPVAPLEQGTSLHTQHAVERWMRSELKQLNGALSRVRANASQPTVDGGATDSSSSASGK